MAIIASKRRSSRVHVHLPLLLLWKDDQGEHREPTFTLTVSWFGCAVHSRNFFRPKSRVRLQREAHTMEAQVVYSLKDHATDIVEVGLKLDRDGREFWGIWIWGE